MSDSLRIDCRNLADRRADGRIKMELMQSTYLRFIIRQLKRRFGRIVHEILVK